MALPVRTESLIGRRERKKRDMREALITAAFGVAAERGVERTTVEEITERVDVSVRTFHRYFSSKEDVFFADASSRRERFTALLAERPSDEILLESLRNAARTFVQTLVVHPEWDASRQRLVLTSESLQARSLRESDEWVRLVANYCARRLGVPADGALPDLLASCTVAAIRNPRQRWLRDRSIDLPDEVDRCFGLLGHLADAIAQARTALATPRLKGGRR